MPKKTSSNNLKLVSWNVNGWRAIVRKHAIAPALDLQADIYSFQETKTDQPELDLVTASQYELSFCSAEKKGYSGTLNLANHDLLQSKNLSAQPLDVNQLFTSSAKILTQEGRICPLEISRLNHLSHLDHLNHLSHLDQSGQPNQPDQPDRPSQKILLLNVYFPNGGMGPVRLQYKMDFYHHFLSEMTRLRATKKWQGIVVCGDVNTAHQEIDLARPKENSGHTGFLPMEREWVSQFLESGFIDTFRYFYPQKTQAYSWWDYKTRARERNVGWRIDYFFVSQELKNNLLNAEIEDQIIGSDHAPLTLTLEF